MKPLIVGNWKMNPQSFDEALKIFSEIAEGLKIVREGEVVLCPSFVHIFGLGSIYKGKTIAFGAQDVFWEEKGAFTGEVSPLMLRDLGCRYAIVGHSERRALGESNKNAEDKLKAALKAGLTPIFCIDKLSQIPRNIRGKFFIAYEPLFAIGTGKPCPPAKAKKMRILIERKVKAPVLYGGSVDSKNAASYIKEAGYRGLLVGGASLKPKEFVKIVRAVVQP